MHGLGLLVWVVLLIVGVISSIISSARRQSAQRAPHPGTQQQRTPPPGAPAPGELPPWLDRMVQAQMPEAVPAPRPPAPKPAAPRRDAPKPEVPGPPAHALQHPLHPGHRLFGGKSDLVRAVIAAEVLGKPQALRDEYPLR